MNPKQKLVHTSMEAGHLPGLSTYTDVLSPEELAILTGKKYHGVQIRELNHMGISHRTRVDGSVVVVRADLPKDKPALKKQVRLVIND